MLVRDSALEALALIVHVLVISTFIGIMVTLPISGIIIVGCILGMAVSINRIMDILTNNKWRNND